MGLRSNAWNRAVGQYDAGGRHCDERDAQGICCGLDVEDEPGGNNQHHPHDEHHVHENGWELAAGVFSLHVSPFGPRDDSSPEPQP